MTPEEQYAQDIIGKTDEQINQIWLQYLADKHLADNNDVRVFSDVIRQHKAWFSGLQFRYWTGAMTLREYARERTDNLKWYEDKLGTLGLINGRTTGQMVEDFQLKTLEAELTEMKVDTRFTIKDYVPDGNNRATLDSGDSRQQFQDVCEKYLAEILMEYYDYIHLNLVPTLNTRLRAELTMEMDCEKPAFEKAVPDRVKDVPLSPQRRQQLKNL